MNNQQLPRFGFNPLTIKFNKVGLANRVHRSLLYGFIQERTVWLWEVSIALFITKPISFIIPGKQSLMCK